MIRAAAGMHMRRPSLASLASNASAELPRQPNVIRFASAVSGPKVPKIKITDNVSLQESPHQLAESKEKRPLVLLLSWFAAKRRHLGNFERFYLNHGCDVLTVKVSPLQVMLPETGSQVIAKNVVNFIQEGERKDQPIFVHGFSVGGYVYSEILLEMFAQQKETEISGRIIGQVYDSLVDMNNIPSGMAQTFLPKSKLLQMSFQKSLEFYLRMTYNFVGHHHERGSHFFRHNPVKAPTLFFYSDTDPLSNPRDNQKVIATLREKVGNPAVEGKSFQNSPHVSHMYKYREEYIATLKSFLNQIEYFKKVSETGAVVEDEDDKTKVAGGRAEGEESSV